jgi:hypothetical protein
MALKLKQFFLQKEYNDVYVNIDVADVHDGNQARVFLSYWKDELQTEKIYGDYYDVPFDKKSSKNLYTQCYEQLKKLPEFSDAEDA